MGTTYRALCPRASCSDWASCLYCGGDELHRGSCQAAPAYLKRPRHRGRKYVIDGALGVDATEVCGNCTCLSHAQLGEARIWAPAFIEAAGQYVVGRLHRTT